MTSSAASRTRQSHFHFGDKRKHSATLMAADRAFRFAGRPRGVHQCPGIVAADIDAWPTVLCFRDQILIGAISGMGAGSPKTIKFSAGTGSIGAYGFDCIQQFVLDDERLGFAVFDDVLEFLVRSAEN